MGNAARMRETKTREKHNFKKPEVSRLLVTLSKPLLHCCILEPRRPASPKQQVLN